jgi:hypothetical protein
MKTEKINNRFDMFSYPVYGFNVNGDSKMGSWTGIFCTLVLLVVMSSYTALKFIHLM